jgi:hypothetical protein
LNTMFENGGGGGTTIPQQLHVNQALLVQPIFNPTPRGGADHDGRGGGAVSIYSHSTITSTTVGPNGTSQDGTTGLPFIYKTTSTSCPPVGRHCPFLLMC